MAINEISNVVSNLQIDEVIKNLPLELAESLSTLIIILKALGIIFIIYLIFLIANIILNIRRNLRIKEIEKKVNQINEKLDKVLASKKHKEANKK